MAIQRLARNSTEMAMAVGITTAALHGAPLSAFAGTQNKEALLAEVLEQRAMIDDLSASFTFSLTEPLVNAQTYEHRVVSLNDSNFLAWRTYELALPVGSRQFTVAGAFDGDTAITYYQRNASARMTVDPADADEINTHGSGFFDLMLFFPCHGIKGEPESELDLVALLSSDQTVLRAQTEVYDGHVCHVLDVFNPQTGLPAISLWLDAERGCLPLRQAHYTSELPPQPIVEFLIDEAVALDSGLWVPVRGRRVSAAHGSMPELAQGLTYLMQVDGLPEGNPQVSSNAGLDDAHFNLLDTLPAGTMVTDVDSGQTFLVHATDYMSLAESVLAAAPTSATEHARNGGSQILEEASDSQSDSVHLTYLLALIAAAVGAGIWCGRLR